MLTVLTTFMNALASEPSCTISMAGAGDPRSIQLDWSRDEGRLLPEVVLGAIDSEGIAYTIEFVVGFAGHEIRWSDGPYELGALQSEAVTVSIPKDAYIAVEQAKYASTLVVTAYGRDGGSGAIVASATAPGLRLIYNSPRGVFDFYNEDEFAIIAPYGFVGEPSAGVAEILEAVLSEGDVVQFGPGI